MLNDTDSQCTPTSLQTGDQSCKNSLNTSEDRGGIERSKSKSKSKIGFFDLSSYRSELES